MERDGTEPADRFVFTERRLARDFGRRGRGGHSNFAVCPKDTNTTRRDHPGRISPDNS